MTIQVTTSWFYSSALEIDQNQEQKFRLIIFERLCGAAISSLITGNLKIFLVGLISVLIWVIFFSLPIRWFSTGPCIGDVLALEIPGL